MTRALKTLRLKLAEYLPLILVQLIMKNFWNIVCPTTMIFS
jgi:hypothetical protein